MMDEELELDSRPTPTRRRWWIALAIVAVLIGVGTVVYFVARPAPPEPVVLAKARQVTSAVVQDGDSLQVIVEWDVFRAPDAARGDSLRVEVRVDSADGTASRVRIHPGIRRHDTLYVPAPGPGMTADGLSCVAPQYRAMVSREICTPWRYVRPAATEPTDTAKARAARQAGAQAALPRPMRIVVQPSGIQVDPDIGGRCLAWQRQNPNASVWIEVNRTAVPACTGPNNRPTVAQFCAFAELADGRRVKTANSANSPYCDQLFRAWTRERVS